MCVVSMIVDHYRERWGERMPYETAPNTWPPLLPIPGMPPPITPEQLALIGILLAGAGLWHRWA
jgi:hypothetical protein